MREQVRKQVEDRRLILMTTYFDYISQIHPTGEPADVEPPAPSQRTADPPPRPTWPLGQAKARFSEVVRLARAGQPQCVTVHGRDAVVIVASTEFERLTTREVSPTLHGLLSGSPLSRMVGAVPRPKRFRHGGQ